MLVLFASTTYALVDVLNDKNEVVIGEVSESDIPKLVEYLVQGGAEAEYAAKDLVEFGDKSVPELLKALKEGEADGPVLSVLAQVMDETAVEPVSAYVNDPSETIRNLAIRCLINAGDAATPNTLELLQDSDTRKAAVEVLEAAKLSAVSLKLIRKETVSDDPYVRGDAAYLLGLHKYTDAKDDIIRLLKDDDPAVRALAARGYLHLYESDPAGYDKAVVLDMLNDKDPAVEVTGVHIAASAYNDAIANRLLGMLSTATDHEVAARSAELLASKGDDKAVLPIVKRLDPEDPDLDYQTSLIWSLGELKAAEAVPYLIEPFESGKTVRMPIVRETFEAMANIGQPVDLSPFLGYLEEGDPHHNATNPTLEMISALARPGDGKVIEALKQFRDKATLSQKQQIDAILKRIE